MRTALASACAALLVAVAGAQPPALDQLKSDALRLVGERSKLTQQMMDSIYSFAEIGFPEVEISAYLTAILENEGSAVTHGVAGLPTGFVASGGSGRPVIGSMADLDGLTAAFSFLRIVCLRAAASCVRLARSRSTTDCPDEHGLRQTLFVILSAAKNPAERTLATIILDPSLRSE